MLVGHYAVGLVAKRVEPRVSLGTLFVAALLADFVWCFLMFAGVEHVQFKPGRGSENYAIPSDISWSHSLLTNAVWGIALAAAYLSRRKYPRGAVVIFLAAVSHWLLDWIAHRPIMSLAPGTHRYYGLGLWSSIPATLIVEGGFWLLAVILYARAARPRTAAGSYVFWIGIILFTLAWYNNIAGPPPSSPEMGRIASLIFFSLTVAWAYWVNRLRPSEPALAGHD